VELRVLRVRFHDPGSSRDGHEHDDQSAKPENLSITLFEVFRLRRFTHRPGSRCPAPYMGTSGWSLLLEVEFAPVVECSILAGH
jgi:hypothetical protein